MPKRSSRHKRPAARTRRAPAPPPVLRCEADVVEGLEDIARREIAIHLAKRVELHRPPKSGAEPGLVRFDYQGGLRALLRLKTVQGVHVLHRFDVPRPKALLGDEHLRRLLALIDEVRAVHPPDAFRTLYVSAAGTESAVMQRLRNELAQRTGLTDDPEEGDLLLRLRRPARGQDGWIVAIRIAPRPLATRAWRVCNMEGALNATIAHAMILMTDPQPYDTFVNLACGSGSLLIERLTYAPAKRAIGCDTDSVALACAADNVAAGGFTDAVELTDWDARALPLDDASVDALCADLPFGHLVGSHEDNVTLYPAILAEAARVAKPGALLVVISHEIKLMDTLIAESTVWQSQGDVRVTQGGLHPRIYVLRRA